MGLFATWSLCSIESQVDSLTFMNNAHLFSQAKNKTTKNSRRIFRFAESSTFGSGKPEIKRGVWLIVNNLNKSHRRVWAAGVSRQPAPFGLSTLICCAPPTRGLRGYGAGWSSSRAGASPYVPLARDAPSRANHRGPHPWQLITTQLGRCSIARSLSDKHGPPRCMFNIQENYIVTANTKRLAPYHLIASRFKSYNWPRPVGGE